MAQLDAEGDANEAGGEVCVLEIGFHHGAEAETVANEINACGGDAIIHKADVTDPEQVRAMINEIVARSGTVHVLVNSAASNFRAIPFLETTWENVQDDLDVIVKGAFNCAQAVLPLMIAQGGGKIVNLSTVAVEVPPQDQFKYVVAKSALTGITRSLARSTTSK